MPISSTEILQIIRRELNQSLVGELQSSHAQAVAALIDEALRHVIARLEIEPDLVAELTDAYARLQSPPANTARVAPHRDDREQWRRALAAASSVEPVLLRHLRADVAKKPKLSRLTDPFCLQALAAEHAMLRKGTSFERALQHPTYSAEQLAQLEVTPERLAPVLLELLADRREIRNVRITPSLAGFSKETFLVDFDSSRGAESIALRRDNPQGPVDSTVADEFYLLRALHQAGMPVAEPLALETDAGALGHPFLITRKMPGGTVPNTRGIDVGPEHIRTLLALAEFLARLHSADLNTLGLSRVYFKPELSLRDVLLNDLDRWEGACRSELERAPLTITSVFEWLRLNVPDEPVKLALLHGDAGPHNMLMHEGKVTAVLDWELAHAGDPCEDLTYCRMWIDQIMPFEDFLQHYYRHGGPEYSAERGRYYATFIHARHITTSIRAYTGLGHAAHPQLSAVIAMIRYGRMFELAAAEDIADLSH